MNAGEKTLEWLRHEQLRVDDKWSVDLPNGFAWWAAENRQSITIVGSEEGPDGEMAYWIGIETEVFRDVEAEIPEEKLADLNTVLMMASMAGLVHKPEEGRMNLCSVVRVHEGIREWMAPLISIAAMIQLLEAREFLPMFGKHLDWTMAESGHPDSGGREVPDELVFGVREILQQTGSGPSRWESEEFERAHAAYIQGPPGVLATAGGNGITVEFPYGSQTSLCRFVADQPHPVLENGLLRLQQFPVAGLSESDSIRKALDMNRLELTGMPAGYGLGSYAYNAGCICFSGFIPNCAYRSGLLPNLYFAAAGRAYFADRELT